MQAHLRADGVLARVGFVLADDGKGVDDAGKPEAEREEKVQRRGAAVAAKEHGRWWANYREEVAHLCFTDIALCSRRV